MSAVRIEKVSKRFGATVALSSVTLEIPPGEICFLLGPSRVREDDICYGRLRGLSPPTRGRIFLGDLDITHTPPHRRGAAMMFQSYALWPHLTVERNVAFGLEEQRTPRKEINARVAGNARDNEIAMNMPRGASMSYPAGSSSGSPSRGALVVKPRCLLLDEPLSNLDSGLRVRMRGEIRRLCKEFGLTAIYVSHDQKEALAIGDRIVVMDAGRILQSGAPYEVYRRPESRFVAEFLGETNLMEVAAGGEIRSTIPLQPSSVVSVRPESLASGSAGGGDQFLRGSDYRDHLSGRDVAASVRAGVGKGNRRL